MTPDDVTPDDDPLELLRRMIDTAAAVAAVALIVRSPGQWVTWARTTAGAFGDALAGALGEPRPAAPERSPIDIWLHPNEGDE